MISFSHTMLKVKQFVGLSFSQKNLSSIGFQQILVALR